MKGIEKRVFSMQEAAKELNIQRGYLFKFLRRYGIIVNSKVQAEFLFMEYFQQGSATIRMGSFGSKQVDKVFVTSKGIIWIKKLMKLLTPTL
jgi:phage antirepressor YoqD-like protein